VLSCEFCYSWRSYVEELLSLRSFPTQLMVHQCDMVLLHLYAAFSDVFVPQGQQMWSPTLPLDLALKEIILLIGCFNLLGNFLYVERWIHLAFCFCKYFFVYLLNQRLFKIIFSNFDSFLDL